MYAIDYEDLGTPAECSTALVTVEIDGHPIVRQAQILHLLGEKYEGDIVTVKIERAGAYDLHGTAI